MKDNQELRKIRDHRKATAAALAIAGIAFAYSSLVLAATDYRFLYTTITTGSDNARSDSVVRATFFNSSTAVISNVIIKHSGVTWDSHSVSPVWRGLNPALPAGGLTSVQLTLEQHGSGLESSDTWDLQGILLILTNRGNSTGTGPLHGCIAADGVINCPGIPNGPGDTQPGTPDSTAAKCFGNPLAQLTASNPTVTILLPSCAVQTPPAPTCENGGVPCPQPRKCAANYTWVDNKCCSAYDVKHGLCKGNTR